MSKPKVLITNRYSDDLTSRLAEYAEVIHGTDQSKGMPREDVLGLIGDCVGVITQNELRVGRELAGAARKLGIVANSTAGFDNMDIVAMRERRIWGAKLPRHLFRRHGKPRHRPAAGIHAWNDRRGLVCPVGTMAN